MSKKLITIEVEGQHVAWINELNDIKDEIKKYENTLAQIASSENNKKVERFQNQFLIQQNAVDKLKNEIKRHNMAIERDGDQPFDTLKKRALEYHKNISQKIETEVKIMKELKEEFIAFVNS